MARGDNRRFKPPAQNDPVLSELVAEMDRAWTQEELAARYGGSPGVLSKMRQNAGRTTFETVTWIAGALGYRLTLERLPNAPKRPTIAKPDIMVDVARAWNAEPYRSLSEIGKDFGVSRDAIAGHVNRARIAGLVTRPKGANPAPKVIQREKIHKRNQGAFSEGYPT